VASEAATVGTGAPESDAPTTALLGGLAFVLLAFVALAWAKWIPYAHKLRVTDATGAYPGHDVLAKAGRAGSAPSLARAWTFTEAYAVAIWPALVAGLTIAASIEALLPRRWLLGVLGHDGLHGRIGGGLSSLPSMMCTCCSAPVVWALRGAGVPTGTALAYWLGNPVLNPAVLAFLAIVLPWQWVATRVTVGVLLVFVATGLVARLAGRGHSSAWSQEPPASAAPSVALEDLPASAPPRTGGGSARRFGLALLRMAAILLPEYLIVVLLVGLFRGWLLPIGASATHLVVLFTVLAAVAGTLVVIPTGGEIPLIAALAAGGLGKGPLGALLLTLPAISLPSMAMVGRVVGWRVTLATAAAVVCAGALAGGLLWALNG
jgi:uncharacterized membrane protein YraQ (UPF0718 family)